MEVELTADTVDLKEIEQELAGVPASQLEGELDAYLQNPAKNRTRIDKIAKIMFNDVRVRKICRLRAIWAGVDINEVDEVQQRTMEVFFARMLQKMQQADAVYAVVYAIASNVSREVAREATALTYGHDSIEEMRESGDDLQQSDLAGQEEEDRDGQVDTRIFRSRVTDAYKRVLAGEITLNNVGVYDETLPMVAFEEEVPLPDQPARAAAPTGTAAGKKEKVLSPDQQELVDAIRDSKLRNQDFALLLGIGLPRLSSYIYGRTASVPPEVMTSARAIRSERVKSMAPIAAKFDRPMSEILESWEKQIGEIPTKEKFEDTNEALAMFFSVTTMTIHRWRQNATKPDLTALTRYDQLVQFVARRVESAMSNMTPATKQD